MGDDVLPVVAFLSQRVAGQLELLEIDEARQLLRDGLEVGQAVVGEKEDFEVGKTRQVTAFEGREAVAGQEKPFEAEAAGGDREVVLLWGGGDAAEFSEVVVVEPELLEVGEEQNVGMERRREVASRKVQVRHVTSMALVAFENDKWIAT